MPEAKGLWRAFHMQSMFGDEQKRSTKEVERSCPKKIKESLLQS